MVKEHVVKVDPGNKIHISDEVLECLDMVCTDSIDICIENNHVFISKY